MWTGEDADVPSERWVFRWKLGRDLEDFLWRLSTRLGYFGCTICSCYMASRGNKVLLRLQRPLGVIDSKPEGDSEITGE